MTDGMMEAARDLQRGTATEALHLEMLACVEDSRRDTHILLECAKEVDGVRGGMVGTTHWAAIIEKRCSDLRAGDRAVWIRWLARFAQENSAWVMSNVNLYDRFKTASPFAKDLLCFELPYPDLYKLGQTALRERGMSTEHDAFAFVLRIIGGRVVLEPLWLRQTSFPLKERPRTGPIIKSRK